MTQFREQIEDKHFFNVEDRTEKSVTNDCPSELYKRHGWAEDRPFDFDLLTIPYESVLDISSVSGCSEGKIHLSIVVAWAGR